MNLHASVWAKERAETVENRGSTAAVMVRQRTLVSSRSRGAGGQRGDMAVLDNSRGLIRLFGRGCVQLVATVYVFLAHYIPLFGIGLTGIPTFSVESK